MRSFPQVAAPCPNRLLATHTAEPWIRGGSGPGRAEPRPGLPRRLGLLAYIAVLLASGMAGACLAQETTAFRGPYLGQTPPGDTPVLFAPAYFQGVAEYHSPVVFSPDGTEAYWTPSRSGPVVTGSMARMVDGVWAAPQDVDFGLEAGAREVAFSPDGETILFVSTQRVEGDPPVPEGRSGPERIWYAPRTPEGIGTPRLMPEVITSRLHHWQFSMAEDRDLYFTSWGPETRGEGDILVSRFVDGEYLEPVPLGPAINSDDREICPFIAPDESYLIFSRAPSDVTLTDLFISYRLEDGSWTEAERLPSPVNSESLDLYGVVSPDGRCFFFLSARGGDARIYWVDAGFIRRGAPGGWDRVGDPDQTRQVVISKEVM